MTPAQLRGRPQRLLMLAVAAAGVVAAASCSYDFDFDRLFSDSDAGGTATSKYPPGTLGEQRRARFLVTGPQIAWRDNWIRLDRAIMRSAEGKFAATLEPDAGVAPANPRFASSKSPILEVEPHHDRAQEAWFTATEEGSVWVLLIADDGSPIDRIHVEVSAPVGLFLSFVEDGGATLFEAGKTVDLTPGQVRHIDTRAVDAQGGTLIASNSIVWTLPDTNV